MNKCNGSQSRNRRTRPHLLIRLDFEVTGDLLALVRNLGSHLKRKLFTYYAGALTDSNMWILLIQIGGKADPTSQHIFLAIHLESRRHYLKSVNNFVLKTYIGITENRIRD